MRCGCAAGLRQHFEKKAFTVARKISFTEIYLFLSAKPKEALQIQARRYIRRHLVAPVINIVKFIAFQFHHLQKLINVT